MKAEFVESLLVDIFILIGLVAQVYGVYSLWGAAVCSIVIGSEILLIGIFGVVRR